MRDLPLPTQPLHDLTGRDARASRRSLPGREAASSAGRTRLVVAWARDEAEVREAQRLRHQVFVDEMGARLSPPQGTPAGLDVDLFDAYCEHLLVRAVQDDDSAPVIGTYRVLTPDAARRVGGLYSETEFDLVRLRSLRPTMVELGRSCVHPDHRHGGAILALWGALAEFMHRNQLDTMVGCASISMRDGGHLAASLWEQLRHTHLAPIEWRVRPRLPLPVAELRSDLAVDAPPLIKGYLRCGARVLGAPAWDPDFNTADLPLLMRIEDLPAKYRRHFLGHEPIASL
ncbi:GNAT family N-acetyltransferase [Aquariibacter albus]|uniref:L-ornithine N(alpha)-acyltransferase n=1 Tax=Aquariibacter albus TaxID=2759899 RepID=A0A839HLC6_9BURK|nr:GNAT family N-acyltransferase [Aquariibacter albus]MBB1163023.1 GNAT family N-acetyltransferase [Aquariibacter albus]